VESVATRRWDLTSTPSHASPARHSSDEMLLRDSSVFTFSNQYNNNNYNYNNNTNNNNGFV